MYAVVAGFHARAIALSLAVSVSAACGGERESFVEAGEEVDAAVRPRMPAIHDGASGCDDVEIDGEFVIERERDFTARYRIGERYTRTVMLFGGEPVEQDNILSNAYIFALEKGDAQRLAETYPDFHLCSSPGGMAAASYIRAYDLVPATCEVHEQIASALRSYHRNASVGGDRTSLRFEGAPLQVESVIADASGEDVADQVADQNFHLVTGVEQLTGQSVLGFGTSEP